MNSTESSGCNVLNFALLSGEIGLLLAETKSCRFKSLLILIAFKDCLIVLGTFFLKYGFELTFYFKNPKENALA